MSSSAALGARAWFLRQGRSLGRMLLLITAAWVLASCGEDETPTPPPEEAFYFALACPDTIVSEDSDSLVLSISRGNASDSAWALVRIADGSATWQTDFFCRLSQEALLLFPPGQHALRVPVLVLNDRHPEPSETFVVLLHDVSPPNEIVTPDSISICILDDDSTYVPIEITFPFASGSEWSYNCWSVRASSQGSSESHGLRTASMEGTVDFQGDEYHVLRGVYQDLLLRQDASILYAVLVSDTANARPGTPDADIHASLPWKLCDFAALRDTSWALVSADSLHGAGYSVRYWVESHGRVDLLVPAGFFPDAQRITLAYEYVFEQPFHNTGSGRRTYTIADGVGIIQDSGYWSGSIDAESLTWESTLRSFALAPEGDAARHAEASR